MTSLAPYRPLELMRDPKLTQADFTDFIGIWEGFVPESFCDKLLEFGKAVLDEELSVQQEPLWNEDGGADVVEGHVMYGSRDVRQDQSFMLNYVSSRWSNQLNQFLKSCTLHYCDVYFALQNAYLISTDIKFQRTPPGGGYHMWHYENGSYECAARELTWMVYLNDIPEGDGGETEFVHQPRRIKPSKGTVVIFPAAYTHTHRGGLLLGEQDKYIVTGWYIKTHGTNGRRKQ
jgi:hypothetical protein